ncbi:hypothetical protein CERSUDRAFT_80875 [Gelatoporia subvermispora B]|uniref:NADP-dependent oxidoreductase domain-containing protein n=1 Tax=Ceriporiopsis subvermispora (strain B) TaxID=914234 RepID=M2R4M3_CERS8|nr:hypothetical protein CERSUDRAFT_80875 [Gelatoporia subvermispora B]
MPSYRYKLLSSGDDDGELTTKPTTRRKNVLFALVAAAAALYAMFTAVRFVVRTSRLPCNSRMGMHRNLSSLPEHFTLASGDKIPSVALGVWQAGRNEVGNAVKVALKAGYRHIDDAWVYYNEEEVGQALKDSGVPRSEVWLTSKLWNTFHAPEDVEPALDESLSKLGTDYLDLYLVHWPIAFKKGTNQFDPELTANPYPTWQKLEEMVEKGKVRNIGVSNFNIPRLENLTANPLKIKPAVNQVELNFWNPQPDLLEWSRENGIPLEAYSPLGGTGYVQKSLDVPEVKAIASELGITPAQVLISWHVQRGTIVLPKSVTPSRIEENLHVVALPDDLFETLETAATSHPPHRVGNPSKGWGIPFDIFDDYPYDDVEAAGEREGAENWGKGVV